MLNLQKPKMSNMTFEREFTKSLNFLSDETTYIKIECRAGGWANPELIKARDDINVYKQIRAIQASKLTSESEKYAKLISETDMNVGQKIFEAVYTSCVISWDTNIKSDGIKMTCDNGHFIALADCRIDEITKFFLDFAVYIDDLGNFRSEADEVTEKN
tara:strand:- start:1350 stop:1826 length:477 start_codon:yes stop_codon:yes gene_type:complete